VASRGCAGSHYHCRPRDWCGSRSGRIAQGAHFLSDVVYAGLVVYGTTAVLHWWIVEHDGLAAPPVVVIYRALWHSAHAAGMLAGRLVAAPPARVFLLTIATVALIIM